MERNIKFAEKHKIKYPLVSDEGKISEKLDFWIEKSMYGKKYFGISWCTFMTDSQGRIFKQCNKVKVSSHVKEVLETAKKCP